MIDVAAAGNNAVVVIVVTAADVVFVAFTLLYKIHHCTSIFSACSHVPLDYVPTQRQFCLSYYFFLIKSSLKI